MGLGAPGGRTRRQQFIEPLHIMSLPDICPPQWPAYMLPSYGLELVYGQVRGQVSAIVILAVAKRGEGTYPAFHNGGV